MGIQNLLKFLARSTRDAHISEFENQYVAIDAYCWLHKGIYSCAYELAMKKPTVKYVTYCMRYIEMLLHFKVKPILVFDGRQLFSKSETEKKRREERKKKYEKGKELMRAGKTVDGRKLLAESVDVTHELALNLMIECRKKNIDCIVAPFEADAQLAFFSLNKIVGCVITEDSDLLVYGCDRVMFKMDLCGRGKLVEKSEIHFSLNMTPEEYSEENFRYLCILTGCDYLPSLPSIGPVFALKFIKMLKGNNIYDSLPKLPIYTNKMNIKVTNEYIEGFKIADNTFKHQLVYNPFLRLQVPLRPVKNDDDIVGTKLPEDLAFHLAVGNIDPISMKKVDNFDPDKTGKGFSILWKTDLLPNAIPRTISANSKQVMIESKKRQRENVESDAVHSITKTLKKHCTPSKSFKDPSAPKAINTVPKNGFIFDSKVLKDKKNVSKKENELDLLSSRYFSPKRDRRKDNAVAENLNPKPSDENYGDYLQDLYREYFPTDENDGECDEESETKIETEKSFSEELCSSCKKSLITCSCFQQKDEAPEIQKLKECLKSINLLKKSRLKFNHSLLDEINKSPPEIIKNENSVKEEINSGNSETCSENTSSKSLSVNLSNILSKFDALENKNAGQIEAEQIIKENTDLISDMELESAKSEVSSSQDKEFLRSPSPVFKFQKDAKVSKKNVKPGQSLDTAGTPVSVYFSSPENLNESLRQISSRHTPSSSQRKTSVKSGKSNVKSSSVNNTLFQFGFKKERRSEKD